MGRPKAVEQEAPVEKILAGAMQEFLEHGYAGASMDKIAVAARVSKATVYRHFTGKEALFTELIQQLSCHKSLFQMQSEVSFEEEPAVFLKRFAIAMLNNVTEDPKVLTFIRIIIGESARFPELARAFVRNIEKPGFDFLKHYFATHPKLHFTDPEIPVRTFVGTMIHFVIVRDILDGGEILPMDRDRLLDGLLTLILSNPTIHHPTIES